MGTKRPGWLGRVATVAALAATLAAGLAPPAIGGEHPEEKPAAAPAQVQASDHYVHTWIPMPAFAATHLPGAGAQERVESQPGRMLVVFFLASWCEPCQQLITAYQRIEQRYRRLNVDFVYVFSFDTRDDAQGFMTEFRMPSGFLTNRDVLKAFHNPELPTIYVGDRHGWLANRWTNVRAPELAKLDDFLRDQTAY